METIKDIVAELREHSGELFPPWLIYNEDGGLDVSLFADRIEKAHKREQEDAIAATVVAAAKSASEVYEPHIQSAQVGNAAKMREALVKIYNEIRSYCVDYGAGESYKSLLDRIVDDPPDYTSYRDSILEIDRIVEAALSAPPRNCDRFANAQDAIDAWNSMSLMEQGDFDYITQWLFAEAKGETK